ncbi:hypothetical protein GGX14DRAFT_568890 [Mycena pura]|uniref:Uncharacterized protein n=1 Tax=Mycena pura TaxID=153505 RepID=A0AAD6Y8M9_9AGAR|nr:hypothetical protein GGX14DRAFT_568890 [Mycena pura]
MRKYHVMVLDLLSPSPGGRQRPIMFRWSGRGVERATGTRAHGKSVRLFVVVGSTLDPRALTGPHHPPPHLIDAISNAQASPPDVRHPMLPAARCLPPFAPARCRCLPAAHASVEQDPRSRFPHAAHMTQCPPPHAILRPRLPLAARRSPPCFPLAALFPPRACPRSRRARNAPRRLPLTGTSVRSPPLAERAACPPHAPAGRPVPHATAFRRLLPATLAAPTFCHVRLHIWLKTCARCMLNPARRSLSVARRSLTAARRPAPSPASRCTPPPLVERSPPHDASNVAVPPARRDLLPDARRSPFAARFLLRRTHGAALFATRCRRALPKNPQSLVVVICSPAAWLQAARVAQDRPPTRRASHPAPAARGLPRTARRPLHVARDLLPAAPAWRTRHTLVKTRRTLHAPRRICRPPYDRSLPFIGFPRPGDACKTGPADVPVSCCASLDQTHF